MALGLTNISVSKIKDEMNIFSPNNVSSLNTFSTINMWSFYKPCSIGANATTKIIEKYTDIAPFRMGDFRLYDHSSIPANVQPDFTVGYHEYDNSVNFGMTFINNGLNVKEVDNSITHFLIKVFSDSGRTTQITHMIYPIQFFSVTPPVGHKNDETQRPNSTQIIPSGITINFPNLYSKVYIETWLSDTAENLRARLEDHVTELILHEFQEPNISISTISWSPSPFYEQNSTCSATSVFANNIQNYNEAGDTSWNFSFVPAAVWCSSGVQERVAGDVTIKYYYNGTEYTIKTVTGFYEGQTIVVSEAITGGITQLTYDQTIFIRLYFNNLTTTYALS